MTTYVDTSALLKRYVNEPDSERVEALLQAETQVIIGRHTVVEVRRNLAQILAPGDAVSARNEFLSDVSRFFVVELDERTCELASDVAEQTGLRTLDALHLGAALRVGTGISFLTFDVRQATAARALGFVVLGS